MHKAIRIVLLTLLWVFVVGFVVLFNSRAKHHRSVAKVHSVSINITDSLLDESLLTSEGVRRWIAQSKLQTIGQPIDKVDLAAIEQAIRRNGFVERASAYVTYDGALRIDVSQRRPMLRLLVDGFDSYVTEDGYLFTAPRAASVYVPVVTGDYKPPLPVKYVGSAGEHISKLIADSEQRIMELQREKVPLFKQDKVIDDSLRNVRRMRTSKGIFESYDNFDKRVAQLKARKAALRKKYRYMIRENDKKIDAITLKQQAERDKQKKLLKRYEDFLKLINFVKYIEDDPFWRAEIVQVVASTMTSGDVRLELIPRTGRHIVQFGTLDNAEAKLEKLLSFYEKGLKNIGWDVYRTISVEYEGQVVCTK
ncbi:MAG: hypothetical protein E7127_02780 [Rikenellaceae bacterium]|nr:hypothetical protein [Rikenellaceae bacterium]